MATTNAHVHPVPDVPRDAVAGRRRSPVRRLLLVAALLGLLLGLAGMVVNVVLVERLERIDHAFAGLTDRPAASPGRTFLMVGTRPDGAGGADVPWLEGRQSVEAVMLVVIAPDGRSARVETLPGSSGVARAAATARPSDTVAAVEEWSGRRVEHLVAVDWTTFGSLAEQNGVDPAYTYGSGPAAQQDYLRRIAEGALHQEMRKHPVDLYRALSTTVEGTAVDDDLSLLELDLLVFSLRDLRSNAITFTGARTR